MKISDVRIREVLIPRIYETYASDKLNLQDDDHKRSHYQIIELFTDEGFVGLGEVSDIANRMNPLTAGELRDILNKTAVGFKLDYWPLIYKKTAQELPKNMKKHSMEKRQWKQKQMSTFPEDALCPNREKASTA